MIIKPSEHCLIACLEEKFNKVTLIFGYCTRYPHFLLIEFLPSFLSYKKNKHFLSSTDIAGEAIRIQGCNTKVQVDQFLHRTIESIRHCKRNRFL
jgi:hypothetical protein